MIEDTGRKIKIEIGEGGVQCQNGELDMSSIVNKLKSQQSQ